jgi:hypothetical protein
MDNQMRQRIPQSKNQHLRLTPPAILQTVSMPRERNLQPLRHRAHQTAKLQQNLPKTAALATDFIVCGLPNPMAEDSFSHL